jgi:hypothetical protein
MTCQSENAAKSFEPWLPETAAWTLINSSELQPRSANCVTRALPVDVIRPVID